MVNFEIIVNVNNSRRILFYTLVGIDNIPLNHL